MNTNMEEFGYEVDFIAVGDKSRSGDAICIRWGNNLNRPSGSQFIMIIDGGYSYSAEYVVKHIKKYYYGNVDLPKNVAKVNIMINTHPHSDHFGGIPAIYDAISVNEIAMHRPWDHTGLPKWFKDGRVTANGIKNQLKEGLEAAYKFAKQYQLDKGTDTVELYAGDKFTLPYGVSLYVLGPQKVYYEKLLPDFNTTPTKGNGVGQDRIVLTGEDVPARDGALNDNGDTSAENSSGLILALEMPNHEILIFTGDAGIEALGRAMAQFDAFGLDVANIKFFQIPHHGSCQNLGPTILNTIFGVPGKPKQRQSVSAYVSVAADPDNAHPSRRVINALIARNCNVYKTQGRSLQHHCGSALLHEGWISVSKLDYYPMVEG